MEQDHLKIVVDGDGNAEREQPPPGRASRAPSRLRLKKSLPTERMKFDTQKAALVAFVTASDRGKEAVGATEIAARIGLSPDTAALVNNFFVEAGFVTKEGKGRYKPVESVNEYQRLYELQPEQAAKQLAEPLKKSWYFTEIAKELRGAGKVVEERLINVLGLAAGAGGDRRAQLELVLDWLEYARLIVREDGVVRLGFDVLGEDHEGGDPPAQDPLENDPADAKGKEPTKPRPGETPVSLQVLGFAFEFTLTADDLRKLSPEQIAALFKAVGEVMAIRATTK